MALPNDSGSLTSSALFEDFPIGRTTSVGIPNGFWTGGYSGNDGSVAYLTNGQLYDNTGTAVGAVQLVVNIPIAQVTYTV